LLLGHPAPAPGVLTSGPILALPMSEWRIHRREGRCSDCGSDFPEDEAFFSLLFIEGESLRREDRCPRCFAGPPPGSAGDSGLVFWRTRHRSDRRSRLAVDFEAIEELFLALEGRSEVRLQELRYLLALLLLRKKRLKLVGVRRHGGGETMCLRRPRRAEEYEVVVFELDSERAQGLKVELSRIFEGAGVEALLAAVPSAPESPVAEPTAGSSPAPPK